MKIPTEKLIKNMKILFDFDNYEEIVFPICKTYFLYQIGELKEENMSEFEKQYLKDANNILAEKN